MTQLTTPVDRTTTPRPGPSRRTLSLVAGAFLVFYAAMMAAGGDFAHDAAISDVTDHYGEISQSVSQATSYAGMVAVGVLLFLGAGIRNALRHAGGTWLADVVLLGYGGLAATLASWTVIDAALWRAVDVGDEAAVRAIVVLGDTAFLPLMASMVAIYVGAGIAGLTTGSLPKWLAVTSIVVGVIAPLGPLGFIGAMLLPLWSLVVALTVRAERSA